MRGSYGLVISLSLSQEKRELGRAYNGIDSIF
jgi:hypothetical protein